jgi:hypothetical protein
VPEGLSRQWLISDRACPFFNVNPDASHRIHSQRDHYAEKGEGRSFLKKRSLSRRRRPKGDTFPLVVGVTSVHAFGDRARRVDPDSASVVGRVEALGVVVPWQSLQ